MPRPQMPFDDERSQEELSERDLEYGDRQSKIGREDSVGDEFHKHLDLCFQCRNQPFGLCLVGAKLLLAIPAKIEGGKLIY